MKLISKIGLFLAAFLLLNSLAKAQQIIKKDGVLFTMPINSTFLGTNANGDIVTVSNPLNPTPTKVATFNGDIDVTGTIDPTRVLFSNLAGVSSPTYNPSANNNDYSVRFEEGGNLNFQSNTTTDILHLSNNGNVGIATRTPIAKLDVAGGNINFPATSSATLGSITQNGNRFAHTYGTESLYLGVNSGNYTNTGTSNVGVGFEALKAAVAPQWCTAVGWQALKSYTSGANNTAIGGETLQALITGNNNDAFGDASAYNLATGSSNTAFGSSALFALTSGNQNIGIGNLSASNLTTGTHNIAIGYSAYLPSATGSNQLNIGNIIYGTAIDGTSNTVSSGNVGIGLTVPTARLHVSQLGAKTAATTAEIVSNTATSSTAAIAKVGLSVLSTGTWNGATATNTGVAVAVSGGTTNYAATFNGGNVGIGTTTPLSTLDLNGSVRNAARVVTATTTLLPTDNIILVQNGATNITITIPTTLDEVVISRSVGSTGTITIVYAGGTIEALTGTVGATTSLAALAAIGGGQRFRRDPLVTTRMDRVRQ